MPKRTSNQWLALGAALTGVGGAAAIAYWIYVISGSNRSFWHLFGFVSLGVLAIGVVMLLIGFFLPDSESRGQYQRGGDRSTNVQAGRDIRVSDGEK